MLANQNSLSKKDLLLLLLSKLGICISFKNCVVFFFFSFSFLHFIIIMAYHTSNVMVDSSPSPPGSPGPSQQHRLLNRVSTLFGGGKKKGANMVSASSSSPSADNESIAASQVDSMLIDDRTASCVDSMYSSLQSRRSNYRPPQTNTQNVPAPLRTVQLDNPIVHLPTPPPPSISTPLDNNQHTVKPSQTYSTPLHTPSPSPTSMTDKKTMKAKTTAQKIEDIDAQFNLLMVTTFFLKR